jgi:hypothetical protein
VSTGGVGAAHPVSTPGAAKPQIKDQDDACDRFDQAAHEAHEGFHQIIDGAAAIAHAVIDTMPHVHGPIGQLIHNRFHKNDR